MMPISFDIKYKPNNDYVLLVKWLGKPGLTTEINSRDLDVLIDRAQYIKLQLGG